MTLSMETSCRFCPPGQRVVRMCNETHDTVCASCPPNTFSSQFALNLDCFRCSPCKRREIVKHRCSATKNSVCKCPPGYKYNPNKPCMKCPKGSIAVNDKCIPKKPPDRRVNENNQNVTIQNQGYKQDYTVPIIIGVTCIAVFIILIICFVYCYKKRQHGEASIGKDIDDEMDIPPDLPLKKGDYRYMNDYAPNPRINLIRSGRLHETPLSRRTLPGSVVDDLRSMLDHDEPINVTDLARELGYDNCFIKRLKRHPDRVEFLINDYLSTCPTKESFYEALLRIGHKEAADLIWGDIPSVPPPLYDTRVVMMT